MGKQKYNLEIVREMFLEKGYVLLSKEYVNTKQKLEAKTKDGFKFEVSLQDFKKIENPNLFSFKNKYISENLELLISKNTPNNELVSVEFDGKLKIRVRCKKHNREYITYTGEIKKCKECFECGIKKTSDKQRLSIIKINELLKNKDIKIIGEYSNNETKTKFKCKKCGHIWEATWNNVQKYKCCPKCNGSKGEKAIISILEENGIEFEFQKRFKDCKKIRPLPFDFYIKKHNLIIEYDGEFHYEYARFYDEEKAKNKLKEQKENDLIKNLFCRKNNIKLIRIPYWEAKNIETILKKELQI